MVEEASEIVVIVDRENNVIGSENRKTMRENILIHRSTYIFIQNSKKQFHVHKRTMQKKWCPGYWDVVSGGCVQFDESYEENARRELNEELGLQVPLTPLFTFYFENESSKIWGKTFHGFNDGPLTLQKEEVELVEMMSSQEIEERISKGEPFTPDSLKAYEMFKKDWEAQIWGEKK